MSNLTLQCDFVYTISMTKQPISNEDIMAVLQDFMQMVSDRFDRLEERMDKLENRMDRLEKRMDALEERVGLLESASREHIAAIQALTTRIDRIEAKLDGIDGDITYLYKLIENLKHDLKKGKMSEEQMRSRLEEVEAIARQLQLKYGAK